MTRASYNFIRGMGSVLDLMPQAGASGIGAGIDLNRSDAEALRKDCHRVAGDFGRAFDATVKDSGHHVKQKQAEK